MNESRQIIQKQGVSLLSVLTVVFVVLKLTHVIAWSWWWVLVPTWGPAALFLSAALVALIAGIVNAARKR